MVGITGYDLISNPLDSKSFVTLCANFSFVEVNKWIKSLPLRKACPSKYFKQIIIFFKVCGKRVADRLKNFKD